MRKQTKRLATSPTLTERFVTLGKIAGALFSIARFVEWLADYLSR